MAVKLAFRDLAVKDMAEAYQWYESHRLNLGEEFLSELEEVLFRIQKNPESFPIKEWNYRSLFLRRFPYEVVYRLERKQAVILAVYHGKRNPKRKLRRRKNG